MQSQAIILRAPTIGCHIRFALILGGIVGALTAVLSMLEPHAVLSPADSLLLGLVVFASLAALIPLLTMRYAGRTYTIDGERISCSRNGKQVWSVPLRDVEHVSWQTNRTVIRTAGKRRYEIVAMMTDQREFFEALKERWETASHS